MEQKKVLYVGVMGFSGQNFDIEKARVYLKQVFDLINAVADPKVEIAVVSGLTYLGVPAIAYETASEYNWITVGIACPKANDYTCFPCDETVIIGENWGDESPAFLEKCDVFVRVGGGKQSFQEVETARAMGKVVIEFDLEALPN